MECKEVEELMSDYIENELPQEVHDEITRHIEKCLACEVLKKQVEDLLYSFTDLEEDVPFFLQNRLLYIPESQENIIELESRRYHLKWVAAIIGTVILFLNLFYFTNIFPPANRALHTVVAGIQSIAVKTEAIYEKVKESDLFSAVQENDPSDDS
ncbi:MAG: hypothetical protein GY757_60345 [bacterium]|nr:hypothetical protein [bacterium]